VEKISKLEFPIHLKIGDVAQAAKEALENGTLQGLVSPGQCKYWCEKTKTQCAVGQAFTPKAAAELQTYLETNMIGTDIKSVIGAGLITTDDDDAMWRLQRAHDSIQQDLKEWADGRTVPSSTDVKSFGAIVANLLPQPTEA
jgi:hypothetical protein